MIVRPSELSNFCPSPGARKNGMAEGFVRDVQVVHVVIEFIETGSDGDHSLSARTKIRSAAAAGHLVPRTGGDFVDTDGDVVRVLP